MWRLPSPIVPALLLAFRIDRADQGIVARHARVGGGDVSGRGRLLLRRRIVGPIPDLALHPLVIGGGIIERPAFDAEIARLGLAHRGEHREGRSEEHTSELQSLMRISYAVFCLKKKKK